MKTQVIKDSCPFLSRVDTEYFPPSDCQGHAMSWQRWLASRWTYFCCVGPKRNLGKKDPLMSRRGRSRVCPATC